ncbi:MAG: nucleotide pyrophosphohydrolase [Acetatifactor sp.]|nr:nucleotide pyrophosphohydrolase [Acetatifactor sp.]
MADITVSEMLELQRKLQEEYKDWWQPNCLENGKDKLLWMLGEVGEVIDVIKKNGSQSIATDAQIRAHFIEEMADVLMFYSDVLLCYGITADELGHAYREKAERNMTRWK